MKVLFNDNEQHDFCSLAKWNCELTRSFLANVGRLLKPINPVLVVVLLVGIASEASAQSTCYQPAQGVYLACGTGPGYFRPQPYTLSGGFPPKIIMNPGAYYAPIGSNQQNWQQYYPPTGQYGAVEPNPFNNYGQLSPGRTARHLYVTRIEPRLR